MILQILKESVEVIDNRLHWKLDRPSGHFNTVKGYRTWKNRWAGLPVGHIHDEDYVRFTLSVNGHRYRLLEHVAIFALANDKMPEKKIDHINGVKTDNRVDNLREVTDSGNAKNNARRSDNNSGVCGVCWDTQTGKWRVQGKSDFIPFRPGRYADFFEAVCVRKSWENQNEFTARHGR